jgi:hypothetical protein
VGNPRLGWLALELELVSGASFGWRREGFSVVTVANFIYALELELLMVVFLTGPWRVRHARVGLGVHTSE